MKIWKSAFLVVALIFTRYHARQTSSESLEVRKAGSNQIKSVVGSKVDALIAQLAELSSLRYRSQSAQYG